MNFFDYFQIAALVIVVLIVVGRASYLHLARNINPIVIGGGKKGFLLAVELLFILGLLAWMIEVLLYARHSAFRISPAILDFELVRSFPVKSIGAALVTLGLVLLGLGYASFGDSWRVGFDVKTPGPLVTRGVFAISRNPIYVFLDLWFIGTFLINGTLLFLIFTVLAVAALHWQILQEEEFLRKLYGQSYQTYCARTGRYLYW